MSTNFPARVERLEDRILYAAGDIDTQFGIAGLAQVDFPTSSDDVGVGVAYQGDNVIVAGFSLGQSASIQTSVARFTSAGVLDTSFGVGGRAQPNFAGVTFLPTAITVLTSGKILIAGVVGEDNSDGGGGDGSDFAVVRLNANGAVDTNFGTGGIATAEFAGGYAGAESIAIDSAGRILLGGTTFSGIGTSLAVARFSAGGTLDNSFDGDGRLTVNVPGGSAEGHAIASAPDGDIVIAGEAHVIAVGQEVTRFAVARLNDNGTPDGLFGEQGISLVDVGTTYGIARGVAVQTDNRVVVAGNAHGPGNSNFATARLLTDGSPDPAFGGGTGLVQTDFGGNDTGRAVAIQPNGSIVVAGPAGPGGTDQFGVVRYLSSGAPDPGFAFVGGKTTIDVSPTGDDDARGLAIHTNGNILIGGTAEDGDNGNLAAARLNTGGFTDATFNGIGSAQADFFTPNALDFALAVELQDDGKIIVGGPSLGISGDSQFALARLGTGGVLDHTFATSGKAVTSIPGFHNAYTMDLAIDDLDRIVAVGTAENDVTGDEDFVIARYMPNGALDTTFGGGDGIVTVDGTKSSNSTFDDAARSVLIQPDGKILVAGRTDAGGNGENFMLVRLTDAGDYDADFGFSGGIVFTDINGDDDQASAVTLDDQNRILAVGDTDENGSNRLALVRYNSNGFRDLNFGNGGRVIEDFGTPSTYGADVVVQPSGGIVLLSTAFEGPEVASFAMARYDDAGELDTSFGVGGRVTTSLGDDAFAFAGRLLVQDDGKLVVTGDAGDGRLAALRYTPGGSPDGTFGAGGVRVISLPNASLSSYGAGAALQDDGRILIAGTTEDPGDGDSPDFAVIRLQADAPQQQLAVTSLTLIDATTDQPIMTLTDGAVLDLAALPAQVNVRADVGGGAAGSVRFGLDGNPSFKTESSAPFALFGNTGNDYWPGTFAAGTHTLTAIPFMGSGATGAAGVANSITFQVIAPSPAALTYMLVDATTDQDIMPLTEGTVLNLATLPSKLNVRANSPSPIGSVRFSLDSQANYSVESAQPYALFGDSGGNYANGTFSTGQHTLTGTPFSGANASGVAGAASTVHFQVVNQPVVTTLTLINAQTDQPLMTLTDGAVLDLSVLGTTHFNVRADTAPGTVGSVWFDLDNSLMKTENTKLYALFGNSGNDYNDGAFAVGSHTLSVRAYSKPNASGTAGPVKTVSFTVVP